MSHECVCNMVRLCAGTAAMHHVAVCLLMPIACLLFDAHMVGEVIIPIKTTKKKKKLKIISVLDRLLSQKSLFVMNTCKILLH